MEIDLNDPIEKAAVKFTMPNGNEIIQPGLRHTLICDEFTANRIRSGLYPPKSHVEGFLTKAGLFVDRTQAMAIARHCGQLKRETGRTELNSEDLW